MGSIGIVFPPDVASRYDKVLRCGGPERSLRKVPSLPVRLGTVNVLCEQIVRNFQTLLTPPIRDWGVVPCGRLRCCVPVTDASGPSTGQEDCSDDALVRHVSRAEQRTVGPSCSGGDHLRIRSEHSWPIWAWPGVDTVRQGRGSSARPGCDAGSRGQVGAGQVPSEGGGETHFGARGVFSRKAMGGGVFLGSGHAKQVLVGHQGVGDTGNGGVCAVLAGSVKSVQRNADLAAARLDPFPLGCFGSSRLGSSGVDTPRGLGTHCESGGVLGRRDAPIPHQRPGGDLFS